MKTLGIKEAAALLRMHPNTLSVKAKRGQIPAAKPSKEWVFLEADLVAYLRSLYANGGQAAQGDTEESPCLSINEATSGGASSRSAASQCEKLLGL